MTDRYEIKAIWKCVCGHSRAGHDIGPLKGCSFCQCFKYKPDHVEQEFIPTGGTSSAPTTPRKPSPSGG